jgi:hypothetical protein
MTIEEYRSFLSIDVRNKYSRYTGWVWHEESWCGDTRLASEQIERTEEDRAINKRAFDISEYAAADRIDPFIATVDDLRQYSDPGDTELILELALYLARYNEETPFWSSTVDASRPL